MAVTYNRLRDFRSGYVTVPLPKRLRNGRFITVETAVWRFQKQSGYLDPEVVKKIRWNF
jgi:hypothetical protein